MVVKSKGISTKCPEFRFRNCRYFPRYSICFFKVRFMAYSLVSQRTWSSLPLDSLWYQWQVRGRAFAWKSQVKNLSEWKHHPVSSLKNQSLFGYPKVFPMLPIFGWRTPPELISLIPLGVPTFFGAISMIRKQEASPTGRWWLLRELILQLWPSVVRHSWHQWMVDDRSSPSLHFGCSKQMLDRRPCGLCFFWRMKYIILIREVMTSCNFATILEVKCRCSISSGGGFLPSKINRMF